ncbi:MAG: hypothetical protein K6G19_06440 [Lachnospiraceae bacterium]|nr:hypothetical protein [Lachnospiraceae bacterium]
MLNTGSKIEYAVVIPAYKKSFDDDEYCCVKAFFEVLTGEKYFVVPEGLDTAWYSEKFPEGKYKTFPDKFFTGTKGYNKLILSEGFYDVFSDYEFILIAQPDAALWSKEDRVPEYIGKGFDYIGAPWIPERRIWEWTFPKKAGGRIKCLKKAGQGITMGNGGFCLRNVKKSRALIHEFRWRKVYWFFKRSEDIFFGVFGPDNKTGYRLADIETGKGFSLEYGLRDSVVNGAAPYATHGWSKEFGSYGEMKAFLADNGIDIV